jgi:hypothetical protein
MLLNKKYGFLIFFLFLRANCIFVFAQNQQGITLHFEAVIQNEPLKLHTGYPINATDSILFSSFKFYISQIQFYQLGKLIHVEPNSYHLIDFSDTNSLTIRTALDSKVPFDEIEFQLGIDSLTNISGAMGGDLDPTKGMYWSWQSGYINLKLEGKTKINNVQKDFNFHLGGYIGNTNPIQSCRFSIVPKSCISMTFNFEELFQKIDFQTQNSIMSPRKEAVELAQKFHAILHSK